MAAKQKEYPEGPVFKAIAYLSKIDSELYEFREAMNLAALGAAQKDVLYFRKNCRLVAAALRAAAKKADEAAKITL